jgi:YD repeat-containing protein
MLIEKRGFCCSFYQHNEPSNLQEQHAIDNQNKAGLMNTSKIRQLFFTLTFLCLSGWVNADTYTYDNLNRLTGVVLENGSKQSYTYDASGNLLSTTTESVVNQPPVANAGADQTTNTGGLVTLNGSGSDPDNLPSPLTYNWSQVSGPSVALTGATTAAPTFSPTVTGTYFFDLTVSDGQASSSDQVMVTVVDNASAPLPTANQPTALNVTKLLLNKKTNAFTLASNITLGTGNNGINPLKESIIVKIGKFATKFPVGAFRKLSNEKFVYVGKSKNAKLKVSITSLENGLYAFQATGKGRNLSKTKNPVTVSLSIGDDNASTSVQAAIR